MGLFSHFRFASCDHSDQKTLLFFVRKKQTSTCRSLWIDNLDTLYPNALPTISLNLQPLATTASRPWDLLGHLRVRSLRRRRWWRLLTLRLTCPPFKRSCLRGAVSFSFSFFGGKEHFYDLRWRLLIAWGVSECYRWYCRSGLVCRRKRQDDDFEKGHNLTSGNLR